MKIKEITSEYIKFDNGEEITFFHGQDCCEDNYADFEQLDDIARVAEFSTPLKFEKVDNAGFRFGDENKMFFVPCYSDQNGYYSSDLQIYYNGDLVVDLDELEGNDNW